MTNFIGNSAATLVVAKWCNALDEDKLRAVLDNETADEADAPELVLDDRTDAMDLHGAHRATEHH